jgi:nucleoside phosphorylase
MPTAFIVTAIQPEYQAVSQRLRGVKEERDRNGTVYGVGSFRQWRVGVAQTGPGQHEATAVTGLGISHFNPDIVLFVGVAGGVKDVKLGDVVASSRIRYYERGVDAKQFKPREVGGPVSYELEQLAKAIARRRNWLPVDTNPSKPAAFVAPIATGEKVVRRMRGLVATWIGQHFSDVLAVEMEGAGFLESLRVHQTPGLVVRGISDLLQNKTEADKAGWQVKAAKNAARFGFDLLAAYSLQTGDEAAPAKDKGAKVGLTRTTRTSAPTAVGRSKDRAASDDTTQAIANSVIEYLAQRPILYDEMRIEDRTPYIESVTLIDASLESRSTMRGSVGDLREILASMSTECRRFLKKAGLAAPLRIANITHVGGPFPMQFLGLVGEFRGRMGALIVQLARSYGISVREPLAGALPQYSPPTQ